MGDSSFYGSIIDQNNMSDLNNHPHFFIFHQCCNKGLARFSIRKAKTFFFDVNRRGKIRSIPQNALIKFVRNIPSTLKWFRSDLTQENINMLRLERPDIELVN
mmetsp:Transcript_40457/g.41024  ORF Transcript_40457/g.41024 Transcript_40457/m.41024 type:complete len:103 (-) Transcript_40457:183-491(-)